MDTSLETIRKQENKQILYHLSAIEAIAKQKSIGSEVDKTIGKLLLQGIGQFDITAGFNLISGGDRKNDNYTPQKTRRTKDLIHKENKDLVRHLLCIRNIVNTKCKRCDSYYGCLGCAFSGRENFNIEAGMRIILLYDWQAVSQVMQFEYYDEAYDFVNSLHNKVGGGDAIRMKSSVFETKYLRPNE